MIIGEQKKEGKSKRYFLLKKTLITPVTKRGGGAQDKNTSPRLSGEKIMLK